MKVYRYVSEKDGKIFKSSNYVNRKLAESVGEDPIIIFLNKLIGIKTHIEEEDVSIFKWLIAL